MRADAAPVRLMPSARGEAGRPRRYARIPMDLHGANPGSARPVGLSLPVSHNEDVNRMDSIISTGRTLAASVSVSLADTGAKLLATGERLKTRTSKPNLVAPAVVAAIFLLSMEPAMAQATGGTGNLSTFLNNVVNLITGPVGQAIAIIAVAVTGLGAMFGALSARAFGGVVLGCAIVFSSAWIVQQITGGGGAVF